MSKHTTVDQLKMLAQRTKTEIDIVDGKVNALNKRVDDIATVGGEPNIITEIKNNGTALAVTNKGVDIGPSIAEAVAAVDRLTRKKVASVDDIDPAAENADKFIYMVPNGETDGDDLYDEYMVMDGKLEPMGTTRVDLTGYLKEGDIVYASNEEVAAMLDEVFANSEIGGTEETVEP